MSKLETLETQIKTMWQTHSGTLVEMEWERALLYAEARQEFPSNKKFGEWVKGVCSRASAITEGGEKIGYLATIVTLYTKEEYLSLGYTKCKELGVKRSWGDQQASFDNLKKDAPTLTKDEIRFHKASISAGNPYPLVEEPKVEESKEAGVSLEERFKQLEYENMLNRSKFLILRGEFVHSETEFFSDIPELLDLQLETMNGFDSYVFKCWGLPPEINVLNIEEKHWTQAKKAMRKYHPDKKAYDERIFAVLQHAFNSLQAIREQADINKGLKK